MNKARLVLSFFLVLLLTTRAFADRRQLFNHTFVALQGGLSVYANDSYSFGQNAGAYGSLTLGKWMLAPTGARLNFSYQNAVGGKGISQPYEMVSFSFMCDPVRVFAHSDKKTKYTCYFYAGAGAVHAPGDNDLLLNCGGNFSMRISNAMDMYVEMGANMFPGGFDGNVKTSMLCNASVGLSYMFKDNPLSRRPSGESINFTQDWYLGVGCGVNSMVDRHDFSTITPSPAIDVVFGKHFSTIWDARVRMSGVQSAMSGNYFGFYGLNGDLMCNMANIVRFKHHRPWNPCVYGGAGIIDNLKDEYGFLFTVSGGFQLRHYVGVRSDVYVDARCMAVPSRFSEASSPLMATITIGYVNNLGKGTCR